MKAIASSIRFLGTGVLALAVCLGGQLAFAGGPTSGPSKSGSEDSDTTPVVSNGKTSFGLVFEGSWEELSRVFVNVRGTGSIELRPTTSGRFEARFAGDFAIRVRSSVLARNGVQVRYLGPQGSMRLLRERDTFVLVQRGPLRSR